MFATPPDLAAALQEELKWEGLDWGKRTNLNQSLDQDCSQCWVQSGGFAVVLLWSGGAFACCHLSPCSVSPHAVVCCCSSSERTHHWLWFPKVTEGYPPAPRWPRTLAKGQHKVYCFIKYGKDGYCMVLSEMQGSVNMMVLVWHDQESPISSWSLRRILLPSQSQPTQTALAFLKCKYFSVF